MEAGGRVEASTDQWYMFRSNNTKLLNLLPSGLRTQARNRLEAELLQTESTSLLEATRIAMTRTDGDQMIGVLAAIKSMSLRAERQSLHIDPCLRIELGNLLIEGNIGYHSLATLDTTPGPQQRVVIEWLKYDAKWSKEDVGEKLFSRIERITAALSSADQLNLPAALKSCGFCHDPGEHRFGQVYNVPPWYGHESKTITLGDILKDAHELHVPALQDRFRLSHTLVSSISAFHQIGWLHRGLHSSNVVFFLPNNCPPSQRIQYPNILGFMHSRENEQNPFTRGPQEETEFRNYHHPDYLGPKKVIYRPEFDYYSLGVLLLEIGSWKPLSSLVASKSFKGISNHEFRRRLVERRLPQVEQEMGAIFTDATRACLQSDFSQHSSVDLAATGSLYAAFKTSVVDRIGECKV